MPCKKPRWRDGLAAGLLVHYLKALAITVGVLAGGVAILLTWHLEVVDRFILATQAHRIAHDVRFDTQGRPTAMKHPDGIEWIYGSLPQDVKYCVADGDGRVLLSSAPLAQALAPPGLAFNPGRDHFTLQLDDQPFAVMTVPVPGTPYHFQMAFSERASRLARLAVIRPLGRAVLGTIVASVLLLSVVLVVTMRRALVPLREASLAAARIEPRNLGARLSVPRMPAELQPLIDAFNLALERLERGFRAQQDFLAAAAHELKTPLALVRGQIELGDLENRDTLLKDIDFMARQVQQLLHLAEVSEPQNYSFEPLDAGAVASDVLGQLGRLADGRRVCLDLRMQPGGAAVQADRGALFVLVKNLVENAILHSPPDAVVAVTLGAGHLRVRDAGAGIAPEHMLKLFTRFWRGPRRRDSGAGLGLAICSEIAVAHGWNVSARNAEPGAEFVLHFAAASA
jgi:two-component system, OmpR family, sensor histidine kinase QseC